MDDAGRSDRSPARDLPHGHRIGASALAAWRDSYPSDPFATDRHLRELLRRALPPDRLAALERSASAFARRVTGVVGPAAARYEQRTHLPELARYDGDRQPDRGGRLRPRLRRRRHRRLGQRPGGAVGDAGHGLRAGHAPLPPLARGRGRARLPGDLHHRPGPRAPPCRRPRGARPVPPRTRRSRLRQGHPGLAVPHRGPGRIRRRGQHLRGGPRGGRRDLPHQRGEVVLLGGRRRPVLPRPPG